jgi:phosphoglycolate phosphatase-like HAD superfamily hydrolase
LPPPGSVRALILDADLILSNTAAWCRSLSQLLAHVGHEPAGMLQHRLWRNQHLADVFRGRRELGDVLEEYLESMSIARGRRDEVLAASLSQWREGQFPLHFLPGVRKTLRRIAATGAKLAIVADSTVSGHEFEVQMHQAGLGDVCSELVTSVDVDSVLPSAALYRVALERLGGDPSEVLCVAQACALAAPAETSALNCAFAESRGCESESAIDRLEDLVGLFAPLATFAKAG